ncbi:DUF2155 domain-containing protein [Aquibaculum sediminis]|uniref:DUF2155 domain-containing protein n=1 Tax=Aquibaculum sediminis TaxID=3231907 RepID=UPI0034523919
MVPGRRLIATSLLALTVAAAAGATSPVLAQERSPGAPHGMAVMQGLDKVTARISTFELRLDEAHDFGALRLVLHACWKTPPEEPPESAAFLEIREVDPDGPDRRVFNGWMYASSPAINPLEHGVYDVWVLDCEEPLS